jgi:hypothetical protein
MTNTAKSTPGHFLSRQTASEDLGYILVFHGPFAAFLGGI